MAIHVGGRGPGHLARTSGVAPVLDLNLTSSLDSRITASGATNGTRVNSSGYIVAATTPRFDHSPTTLAAKGVLIEGERQELLLYNVVFNTGYYAFTNSSRTLNAETAPDGTLTATKVTENSDTAQVHQIFRGGFTATSGNTYAFAYYVKAAGRSNFRLLLSTSAFPNNCHAYFNIGSGVITSTGAGVQSASLTDVGNGWWRAEIVAVANSTNSFGTYLMLVSTGTTTNYNGDGTSGLYIWAAHLEDCTADGADHASSAALTTSATVTRTADSLTRTGANFSGTWNAAQGTIITPYFDSPGIGTRTVLQYDDDTNNNRLVIWTSGTTCYADIITSGTSQTGGGLNIGTITPYTQTRAGIAYAANDMAALLAGGTVQTDSSVTLPTVDRARYGASKTAGQELFGHLYGREQYYNRRITNARLKAILG